MTAVYIYADETGDLGYDSDAPYFGIGTATFVGNHATSLWEGFVLRTHLEASGVSLPQGLHAKNDANRTRSEVFSLLSGQDFRLDTTFLYKVNAFESVKARGPVHLYKTAIYQHLKTIVPQVSEPGDDVYFIAGHLQTSSKRAAIGDAVRDVCTQLATDRAIVPCIWDAPSSWGIQVADYGLWSTQRDLLERHSAWHESIIKPRLKSRFTPWGTMPITNS